MTHYFYYCYFPVCCYFIKSVLTLENVQYNIRHKFQPSNFNLPNWSNFEYFPWEREIPTGMVTVIKVKKGEADHWKAKYFSF